MCGKQKDGQREDIADKIIRTTRAQRGGAGLGILQRAVSLTLPQSPEKWLLVLFTDKKTEAQRRHKPQLQS